MAGFRMGTKSRLRVVMRAEGLTAGNGEPQGQGAQAWGRWRQAGRFVCLALEMAQGKIAVASHPQWRIRLCLSLLPPSSAPKSYSLWEEARKQLSDGSQ